MAFARGAVAGEKKAKESNFAPRENMPLFRLKEDGEEAVVRFVHDGHEWFIADTHSFVSSKIKKDGKQLMMNSICRKDDGVDADECYICDLLHTVTPNPKTKDAKSPKNRGKYFAGSRYYVPVLIMEPVEGTQEMIDAGEIPAEALVRGEMQSTVGRVIRYEPHYVEADEFDVDGNATGKKIQKPDVQLWITTYDQAMGSVTGDWEINGTVLDRNYRIKRVGTGLETDYKVNAMQPTGWLDDATGDITGFDLRDDALRMQFDILKVEDYLVNLGSEEYYARVFDHRVKDETSGGDGGEQAAPAKAAEPEPDSAAEQDAKARIAAVKAGMKKKSAGAESPAAESGSVLVLD